jgi:ABC-type polysaccharide/polyol phosphate export permease
VSSPSANTDTAANQAPASVHTATGAASSTRFGFISTPETRLSLREELSELWRYRELLYILVRRDLKVRYRNSVLGFGWSLLNPLIQVLTITLVLQFLVKSKPENYHAYVFCAMLPWLFFSTAVLDGCSTLTTYHNLIKRTYFPREILPLASVAANLIHFGLATLALLVYQLALSTFWWAVGGKFDWPMQATMPLVLIPALGLTLLVTGISFFVSVWTLYFEDVKYIADSGMKILYWLVPIVYFTDQISPQIGEQWGPLVQRLYLLNPLAAYISAFRKLALVPTKVESPAGGAAIINQLLASDWGYLGIALLTSLAILALGYGHYCRWKWRLAERA